MKNSFKKKFLVLFLILAMILTFSFVPAQRAYAGGIGDFFGGLADIFTGGLYSSFQTVVNGGSLSSLLLGGVLGVDPLSLVVACYAGILCGQTPSGLTVLLPANSTTSSCSLAIPLTFYIPSFNYGYTQTPLCYSDYAPAGGDMWFSWPASGGEHCGGLPSSQRYQGGYSGSCDPKGGCSQDFDCGIQDPNGGYFKTNPTTGNMGYGDFPVPGKCYRLYSNTVPGAIDETHNKIAIYRFSAPLSAFQGDNQALAQWYIGLPGYLYGYGGYAANKVGSGLASNFYSYLYPDSFPTTDTPLAVLDYSKICTGNVCKVEDGNNVPQNSVVFYVAKILGSYISYDGTSYPTKQNKFLTTDNLAGVLYYPGYPDYGFALGTFPYFYKDAYGMGDVYLGPFQTGVPDQSLCSEAENTLTAAPNPVNYNSASTLSWTTSNATSCWATNGWTGWKTNTGGSESTGPLTAAKIYSLECWNSVGVSSGIKTVTVNLVCTPNCNDSGNYCQGTTYAGDCGGTCQGTLPPSCGPWGDCNKGCGGGIQTKSCVCPNKTETLVCNSQPCPPGYREVTPW